MPEPGGITTIYDARPAMACVFVCCDGPLDISNLRTTLSVPSVGFCGGRQSKLKSPEARSLTLIRRGRTGCVCAGSGMVICGPTFIGSTAVVKTFFRAQNLKV